MVLSPTELQRYSRHILLPEIGIKGQKNLQAAKVLVIGAGGLGCPILQYLSAAGAGTIGIIDDDCVEESNLQRQILFTPENIGKKKVDVAFEKLTKANPHIQIITFPVRISNKNALDILHGFDIIVDGSDNFATRFLVNDACLLLNKPLVYGSIFKFEGQVSVFNYLHGPNYRDLFSEAPDAALVPNCSEIGVLGVLPGVIGSYMASEVLKIILKLGDILSGKLLTINLLYNTFFVFEISPTHSINTINTKEKFLLYDYDLFCSSSSSKNELTEITAIELQEAIANNQKFIFLDVRENYETPKPEFLQGLNIPLSQLSENIDHIPREIPLVVYCQHGIRSVKAIEILKEYGFSNLINLTGGVVNNQG